MSIINETERAMIMQEMENLLTEYDYEYDEYVLNQIIDRWAGQKEELITLFKNHPNYIEGKFLIAFDVDFDRQINPNVVQGFVNWLTDALEQMVDGLPEEINTQRIKDRCTFLPNKLYDFLTFDIRDILSKSIDQEIANKINALIPSIRASNGQKTSRVINKICTYLGYNKHSDYNREFAKYADALNPLAIKRHTVLSINPLDYLTMSFGNSWASCHTIDKENKRGMPNSYRGAYSSGTMSYMLDPSSMVFYTVDKSYEGTDYWTQPKINRQMYHWGNEKLIQGRLYPQDNDGCKGEYDAYRNIVQNIMSVILDIPNLWTIKRGTNAISQYTSSYGTHYRDYLYFESCTLSRIKGSENESQMIIRENPICIKCGNTHSDEENICCCDEEYEYCEHCGRRLDDEDDEYWVGDYCYCRDCVSWCENCREYHRDEETYIRSEEIYVCNYCLERYFTLCDNCGEYVRNDRIYQTHDRMDICSECLDESYYVCDDCGDIYHTDDITECDGFYYCSDCYDKLNQDEEAC